MKRHAVFLCALVAALLAPRCAQSAKYYGFIVGVENAPRPPMIRALREPHVVLSGDAMVYVADDPTLHFDGDLFRYGQYWFAYSGGYWYRARSHRGPYTLMEVHKVPRAIIGVPRKLWKHHPLAVEPATARPEKPAKAEPKPRRRYEPASGTLARGHSRRRANDSRGQGHSRSGSSMVGAVGMRSGR